VLSGSRKPFQVIIGVTGHRTLDRTDILRKTVKAVLYKIVEEFSNLKGSEIKLCVISPLVERADRLVVEEILTYCKSSIQRVFRLIFKHSVCGWSVTQYIINKATWIK